ncbi:hypothetical protein OEA41_007959 [Lepraria neglecta]|uniref:Uncharacterized protein n=1 Tax=Lepraria neglecta TaxID=209136 RepID=A0AAE0DNE9_9LECA|nr:hypothetical protein OEA41_007959 [Lepraria neglecta]
MDVPAFKSVQYRHQGRYFIQSAHFKAHPNGLGVNIVDSIPSVPSGPSAYRAWLLTQRQKLEQRLQEPNEYLTVKRVDENSEHKEKDPDGPYKELPGADQLTKYLAIVDRAAEGDAIRLPGLAQGCVANIVLKLLAPSTEAVALYGSLDITIVKPKSLKDIPHSLGHAYLQYARIFQEFRRAHHSNLESLLLGWSPSNFYFRELAYAILCIATASQNLELVSSRKVLDCNEYGFSWVGNFYWDQVINDTDSQDPSKWDTDWKRHWSTDFVAHLGIGSHLEDNPPGSSPPEVIYLFSGALIYLTTQLTRPRVVAEKIAKIIQSRQAQGARNAINALLISIEHVVLVSISQTNQITHTAPLPLFNLRHTSTTA